MGLVYGSNANLIASSQNRGFTCGHGSGGGRYGGVIAFYELVYGSLVGLAAVDKLLGASMLLCGTRLQYGGTWGSVLLGTMLGRASLDPYTA